MLIKIISDKIVLLRKNFIKYFGYYLWLLPALLIFFLFFIRPTLETIILSFQQQVKISENEINRWVEETFSIDGRLIDKSKKIIEFNNGIDKAISIFEALSLNTPGIEVLEKLNIKELRELLTLKSYQKANTKKRVFTGFKNYIQMFKDNQMLLSFRNNVLWLIVFTIFTVSFGLLIAFLVERVKWAPIAKTIIFTPMSISFVASAVIWAFMYEKDTSIGTLNAIIKITGVYQFFGIKEYDGIAFLGRQEIVNWALIVAGIWMWVGYCMVIFSAALRSVSKDIIEASKIDGANVVQTFLFIEIPSIRSTIVIVTTTMMITVLKVFDIVYTLTGGGPFGSSEVIANRMYRTAFSEGNFEYASAMSVILFLAIVPVVIFNLKTFLSEEKIRE